jgi:Glycosyl hydrolases family 2, TIM barrel domain
MPKRPLLALALLLLTTFAPGPTFAQAVAPSEPPVKVEVRRTGTTYQLLRGGKPYFIKGAGGQNYLDRLAAYGGNSIRTWDTETAGPLLAEAQRHGLTVLMCLNVARERHGFSYDDAEAVAAQLAHMREQVLQYKDHPAVLMWGIGNELNLSYTNPKVWDAVNDIAKMIHDVDPKHPATTILAGVAKKEVDFLKARAPALDLLTINTYADLRILPQQIREAGWEGAYVVGEWGPTGHWEGPQTPWKASVEETSAEKAAVYRSRYEVSVPKDADKCLGSYVFLWGQKQERTPTWYGLFTEAGLETEVMDVLQYLWTGKWPANRAPHLTSFRLNGQKATDGIYLRPNLPVPAVAVVTDPDADPLTYRWELLPESTDLKEGGDRESRPQPVEGRLTTSGNSLATLRTPSTEGAYRLFLYATDGHDNVATANIPFYVKK